MQTLHPEDLLYEIQSRARKAGSRKALADELGVNPSVISDILNRRRDPSRKVLKALGYYEVKTYAKAQAPSK